MCLKNVPKMWQIFKYIATRQFHQAYNPSFSKSAMIMYDSVHEYVLTQIWTEF